VHFLHKDASEVNFVSIFKIFKGKSEKVEEITETENNAPTSNAPTKETVELYKIGEKLLGWFLVRMESPEMIEANKNVGDIKIQINAGGNLFFMSKNGIQPFQITSGRCSDPDVLIRIAPAVVSKLTGVNDFTEFCQEYKKYAKLSGAEEYIKINYMKDLSQLSRKGVLRSKLVRVLLMA
jgi:hypothetical protein